MTLAGDELRDLKIDENRQVHLDDTNDLAKTSGIGTVEQSVAIEAGDVLRPLVGEPTTAEVFADVEAELQQVLSRDPQIAQVDRVQITQVNRDDGSVDVQVFTSYNNSFEITVDT